MRTVTDTAEIERGRTYSIPGSFIRTTKPPPFWLYSAPEPSPRSIPTVVSALDRLRLEAVAENAALAADFAQEVAEAAERGEVMRARTYAGLLSRAARNALLALAEIGTSDVSPEFVE